MKKQLLTACLSLFLLAAMPFSTVSVHAEQKQVDFSQMDSSVNGGEPIRGVDISSILSVEKAGVKFYNDDGMEQDIFRTLAEHGVNYIRVRVWNHPYDFQGNGYGGGNCDAYTAGVIGKRAAAYGIKLLVDIQYSDFWADPEKQSIPKDWRGFNYEETKIAIYNHTRDTLISIRNAGGDIGMVQVGNETNCFFCGKKDMYKICDMFKSGCKAVRDFDSSILIALHFANPSTGYYDWYAQTLDDCWVDYDVFATSYYPYWHGTSENLTKVLKTIGNTYDKYVMVAETAYPYTDEDGDTFGNAVNSTSEHAELRFPVSVDGQAECLTDVFQAVANTGSKGIGVFYWEPAWLGVPDIPWEKQRELWKQCGSGWATDTAEEYDESVNGSGGSSYDNQALFDFYGRPLSSLDVFLNISPQKEIVFPDEPYITGDLNEDGLVNAYDLALMKRYLKNGKHHKHSDLNEDGMTSVSDAVTLQKYLLGRTEFRPTHHGPMEKPDMFSEISKQSMCRVPQAMPTT